MPNEAALISAPPRHRSAAPPGAVLRPARGNDIEQLANLLRRSWLQTIGPHLPEAARVSFQQEDRPAAYAEALWREFTVADADGQVVGMVHVQGDLIAAIHVDPDCKRRGLGSLLMKHATTTIARGYPVARLEVLAFNCDARAFYSALGWRETRRFGGEESGAPVEIIEMSTEVTKSPVPVESA